jgi:AcrR family transcriptional regulator
VTRPATKPPAEPLPGASAHVRADIVEAATQVFSERGYHAASMTEIADRVGMRKASLYHHVRKKEDLLFAIHEVMIDELIERTDEALEPGMSPQDKLRAILRVGMRFIARHRDGVTVFLEERRAVTGERWSDVVAKRDRYESMVSGIVADATAAGVFVALPPAIAARSALSMVNWGYTWFDPGGALSADEVADIFAAIVLRGLESR